MFVLIVAALLVQTPNYRGSSRVPRDGRCSSRDGTCGSTGSILSQAIFTSAQQCTTIPLSGPQGTLGFTRASQAYCTKDDGTVVLMANDVPRVSRFGLLVELGTTQQITFPRDMTNAVWVKTNMTAAKTATGADGVANAASTLTATAANGTCVQTITRVAQQSAMSVSIRRRTGTGVVQTAVDNFVAPCDVTTALATAMANGCQWLRVGQDGDDLHDTAEICRTSCGAASQNIANPTVAFKLVTSGDAIDVDFAQLENEEYDSSPIPSGGTRSADLVAIPTGNFPTSTGFIDFRFVPNWFVSRLAGVYTRTLIDSRATGTATGEGIALYTLGPAATTYITRNAGAQTLNTTSNLSNTNAAFGKPRMWRYQWSAAAQTVKVGGVVLQTFSGATNVPAAASTTIRLGGFYDASAAASGWYSDIRWGTSTVDDAVALATVGNSIMVGAYDVLVADAMQAGFGSSRKFVTGFAVSGSSIAASGTQYTSNVQGKGYSYVVDNAGINDLLGGSTAAVAWAAQQPILDGMITDGTRVVIVNVSPCKSYSGCTVAVQGYVTAYNALELAWCNSQAAGRCFYVDSNTLLKDPGDPDNLNPACKAADDLHPNNACSVTLANAIVAKIP